LSIRVVIDTNVVVSALLRPGGFPEAAFSLAIAGEVRLFVSAPILEEYEEVLKRPRLKLDPEKIASALSAIEASATKVCPESRVTAALDPDDNIFLECAESAMAHFLVTGNVKDYPVTWMDTRVTTRLLFLETTTAPNPPLPN